MNEFTARCFRSCRTEAEAAAMRGNLNPLIAEAVTMGTVFSQDWVRLEVPIVARTKYAEALRVEMEAVLAAVALDGMR